MATESKARAGGLLTSVLFLLLPVLTMAAQSAAPPPPPSVTEVPPYTAGISLLAKLHFDQHADTPVFQALTPAAIRDGLTAVISRGQGTNATAQDWIAMHRALDAMIEFCVSQNQLFKGSIYAALQSSLYHADEADDLRSLAAARQALELQKRSGESATLYLAWLTVARALLHLGQVDEAIAAFRQARDLQPDQQSEQASNVRLELIEVLAEAGRLPEAQAEVQALKSAAVHNASTMFRANALLAQATLAIALSRFNEALDTLHETSRAMRGDPKEQDVSLFVSARLLVVGSTAMSSLPYPEAKQLLVRLDKEFSGEPISISGFAREVLNYRRRLAGEFDELLREDNAAIESALAQHHPAQQAEASLALGSDLVSLRDWTHAIPALEEADRLMKAEPAPSLLRFRIELTLASAYLERKNLRPANELLRGLLRAIDAVPGAAERNRYAGVYGQAQLLRARAAVLEDDADTAREILQNALEPKAGQFGKYTRSEVLIQAARTERELRERPAEVVRLYLLAIEQYQQSKDLQYETLARLQLIRYLATEGRSLPGSQQTASDQLSFVRVATGSISLADARWRLEYLQGVLQQNAGQREEAIAEYRRAVSSFESVRAGLPEGDLRQSFLEDDSVQDLYRRLASLQTAAGQRDAAWETLERDKARTFLEVLHGRRFAAKSASDTSPEQNELANLEKDVVTMRVQLAPNNQDVLRSGGQQPEILQARLHTAQSRIALLRTRAGIRDIRSTQPLSTRTLPLASVQRLLPPHHALVEYAVLDGELAAFVVTPVSTQQLHWAANTAALPGELRQLLLGFSSSVQDAQFEESLRRISELLLAHVLPVLPRTTKSLVIVPTQALASIPFQALFLPDGKQVLDRYTVSYLPSAATLQFLKPLKPGLKKKPFVGALGNVSVDGWAPLPGTLTEAKQIQAVYGSLTPVTGETFTHRTVVHALQTFDHVHLATHGLVDEDAPLFSAILVAPSAGQTERLSLYEVMDLRLRAKLVVLSACETNRGRMVAGDEVLGLTRTFLQAGADDVVSSLWKVSDESTALLMRVFHERLHAGRQPATALREAELAVRSRYPAPTYWAAFVNTGVD